MNTSDILNSLSADDLQKKIEAKENLHKAEMKQLKSLHRALLARDAVQALEKTDAPAPNAN